jgi:hypothetical protein
MKNEFYGIGNGTNDIDDGDIGSMVNFIMAHVDEHVKDHSMRKRIAEDIFNEEQKIQQYIVSRPTNPSLNGRLLGLQRARDIAEGNIYVGNLEEMLNDDNEPA